MQIYLSQNQFIDLNSIDWAWIVKDTFHFVRFEIFHAVGPSITSILSQKTAR